MQTANIVLHLGGDSGTTVPKYAITVSEIAVLQAIHGPGSVSEIEPTEDVERTNREEIARLHQIYSRPGTLGVVHELFPGAAARAFQSLDELEIDESFFKPTERAKPVAAAPKAEKPAKRGKKAAEEPVDDAADDVADDEPEDKLFG